MQQYSISTNEIYEDNNEGPLYSESPESIDVLSNAWCTSAAQNFQPTVEDCSMILKEEVVAVFQTDARASSSKSNESLKADDCNEKSTQQWKFDDLTSWIWLQNAIHPESENDHGTRKKSDWVKEKKQRRKEEERLQNAEVHAAISIAGLAAALAAIAAENTEAKMASLRGTAVPSAAALVAAHCGQVAEAVGAKREQLISALNAAMASTNANNIITLTAAAITSLTGAQTLRGRPGHCTMIKWSAPSFLYNEFDFNFGRCRASIEKGDEILVATPDGKCRLRSISASLNKDGKIVLKIKKANMLMAFSNKTKGIIYDVHSSPSEKPNAEEDASYFIEIMTNKGKVELKVPDYVLYKKWVSTINHMLMLSKTFSRHET